MAVRGDQATDASQGGRCDDHHQRIQRRGRPIHIYDSTNGVTNRFPLKPAASQRIRVDACFTSSTAPVPLMNMNIRIIFRWQVQDNELILFVQDRCNAKPEPQLDFTWKSSVTRQSPHELAHVRRLENATWCASKTRKQHINHLSILFMKVFFRRSFLFVRFASAENIG